ncbi:TonB-dependent receptor family protein [Croceivirga thetidis]|uniref:TonB-dependent receptor n=1 Tax=Croceivirga thetidis TaxID=2721623 RepID=A0ABX1GV42_9FLAO|nr:TonB-dependent receptor [Croceivirga thetidis]NKI32790.1 TonB-dependent receptor [Croceivirga thetidis]
MLKFEWLDYKSRCIENLFLLLITSFFSIQQIQAQQDSIPTVELDSVVVQAARLGATENTLPMAVTVKNVTQLQQNLQQLTVNDYLLAVPGVFVQSGNNFAQDARISIRGFGARSAFGIRGVKLVIDGIPETTPDGQGQVDNLNLGLIENIEIIRGASSSLYGNASGGVISVNTLSNFTKDFARISSSYGSYNFQNYQAVVGLLGKKTRTTLFTNRTTQDGYRDHSRFETNQFNLRSNLSLNSNSKLNFQLNYTDSPLAEDPGGLLLDEAEANPSQARDRNVEFNSREAVKQFKTGLAYRLNTAKTTLNSYGYYNYRDFENFLPFQFGGAVDVIRNYWGHGSNLTLKLIAENKLNFQFGYDLAFQNDRRTRYQNLEGERGDATLRQNELFRNFGSFAILQSELNNWVFRGSMRYDRNVLEAEDAFLSNGDASGETTLNTVNPSLGIRYRFDAFNSVFAGFSTSFETPVLSELSANPDNSGGFNRNLREQTSSTFELGYQYFKNGFSLGLTGFYIQSEGEFVPFELEAFPDRTFFRNAGESERFGLELASTWRITRQWRLSGSYAYSDFTYALFDIPNGNFDGNRLPGIPKHLAALRTSFRKNGLLLRLDSQYRGNFFANDSNTVKEDSVVLLNFGGSYRIDLKTFDLQPFFGINNLLNSAYNDNIRSNAFGGRFFEPAPEINGYLGLRLLID